MTLNVHRSATAGTFTDNVVHWRGADAIYKRGDGQPADRHGLGLQLPNYLYQQAWIKFMPG